MKRSPFVCVLLAGVASPAFADDLTIDSILSSPISTSTASNSSPGNITVSTTGGISVVKAGAALTIDSNNTVENQGVIQNAFAGGAIGVHILGGNTGSFSNDVLTSTIINVSGGGTANYGILLDGSSAFTGDISLGSVSTLAVNGTSSIGVLVNAPLIGNLSVSSNSGITGEHVQGVVVMAPITGSASFGGILNVAGTATYTSQNIDPLSGSAIAIARDVTGGILVIGSSAADDATTSASVINSGNAPTIAIQPSIAGSAATDIVIGSLASDAVNPTYSLINRGTVRAAENDPGISTIAVAIGETGTATHTVTLAGGIYNRGQISAQAETDNTFATTAPAASADATGLLIGNGARINTANLSTSAFLNEGSIIVSVTGNLSGSATSVLIEPGGVLSSFANSGSIDSGATTTDTTIASLAAYGVRDLSGTLTTVANSGIITTSATTLDNNAQQSIAVDLSHSAANETLTDSGAIQGGIAFGSGANVLSIEGTSTFLSCTTACLQGAVQASGNGTVDVFVSTGGTGGTFRTANARLSTLSVGSGGTVEFALDKAAANGVALISTTGTTTFGSGAKVSVVPSSFLPVSGTYTLVHSGGTLSFADFASATAEPIPFIFNGSITQQNNDLVLTLQRKSAAQIGLTGNAAAIYEPMAAAALTDDQFGAALLTLSSADEVAAAVKTLVPDVAGGVRALAVAMTDQSTGVVAARERALVTAAPNTRDEFRFWGQEFYNNVNADGTASTPGYNGAGQGVAVGVEWGSINTGRYGLGYTFFSSEEVESHPRDTKTNGDWTMLSFYGGWRSGGFFVTPQINVGEGSFKSRRAITAGTLSRTATADWSSYLAAGGLTTGYIVDVGGFQIIPEIALDGLYLNEGSYTEANAGGLGLSLKSQNQQSYRGFAGVVGQGNYSWDAGNLQPQLIVGWSHEFNNNPATIDGTFESTPGSPFHLVGPMLDPNRIVGGASFAYVLGNWSAGINYDAMASSGSLAQSATISLSSRF